MRFTPEDAFEFQPLLSADQNAVLVCDARIDNRSELSRALDMTLTESAQLPDSVFVLRAYMRWGEECVAHLIGDYSFALWDKRLQRLLIARSALGGRPLYYYLSDGFLAFSSLPKGLFALKSIPRELNLARIADYLVHSPADHGASFYKGLERLHSGHLLTFGPHGVKVLRFWQPDPRREVRYPHDGDYVDAFNALFNRIIADHLRSRTDVGVLMSGGLDSTSVAAVAATKLKQSGKRLATYTEVPCSGFDGAVARGRCADETPLVRTMAGMYDNIDLNFVHTDGRIFLDDLDRFFQAGDIPFRNATNRVWYEEILRTAREQEVRILLTGAQGNLTISRNGQSLLPALLKQGQWAKALSEAQALKSPSSLKTFFAQGILPLLPKAIRAAIQGVRRHGLNWGNSPWRSYSAINPEFARLQRVEERAQAKGFDFNLTGTEDICHIYERMLPGLAMTSNEINHAYRGIFGTDVRDPTADVRIVEFCLALPEEQYLKDGVSRRLIRRAMADKLPAEIINNRQRGLQAADWYERLLSSRERLLHELATWRKSDVLSSILDLELMTNLLIRMPADSHNAGKLMIEYRQLLEFGFMIGRFVLWFERGESAYG
jgi:asparagine synthase (glutamine-hydrolysing)